MKYVVQLPNGYLVGPFASFEEATRYIDFIADVFQGSIVLELLEPEPRWLGLGG
jgi:hypothetical protein